MKLNQTYDAVVDTDGVTVGCQHFKLTAVLNLLDAVAKAVAYNNPNNTK